MRLPEDAEDPNLMVTFLRDPWAGIARDINAFERVSLWVRSEFARLRELRLLALWCQALWW